MASKNKHILFLVVALVLAKLSFSQIPSYNMTTTTVYDCRAKFYDDGGPTSNYSTITGGRSFTFQIVINTSNITMTFDPVPTVIQISDTITFYSQFPLIPANIILGPYTSVSFSTTIIPNVISTTGSLIVVFSENGNSAAAGWNAGWFSTALDPGEPTMSLSTAPSCNDNQLILTTDVGVVCDSLKPYNFRLYGPMFPGVTSVSPVPSACSNGTTNVIQINLTQPINQNCTYTLTSDLFRYDACDSVWKYPGIINNFLITDCAIQASLNVSPDNTVCINNCASIKAVVPASVCLNFSYNWNPTLPATAGPHVVCPTVTTGYTCTITQIGSFNPPTVVTQTIYVQNPYILPLATSTLCLSVGNIPLSASQSGGVWSGDGITNPVTGNFSTWSAGVGTTWIKYQKGSCSDSIPITIIDINAGGDVAACVGAPNFTFSGSPAGGTWYGDPNITPGGIFTPTAIGTYTVLYATGTCTSVEKTISVVNTVSITPNTFTICQSEDPPNYGENVNGFGGQFTGVGITNGYLGTYSPSITPPGQHVITYSINNCFTTFTVNVLEINVSPTSSTVCPTQPPFTLSATATPGGGLWTCTATPLSIQDPTTGLYNPGFSSINTHTDLAVYTATNGCTETLTISAIITTIVRDSVFFCNTSDSLRLSRNRSNFNYNPLGGIYSGPGVVFLSNNYYFKPNIAGPGVHTIYYDANTCRDSVKMIVYPNPALLPGYSPTVCSILPPFPISSTMIPGSNWTGAGIVTPSLGVFNPLSVLPGITTLSYSNKGGCTSTVNIDVYTFQPAAINGLSSTYCFVNTNINFSTAPLNGTFTATSTLSANIFNPSLVGAGTQSLTVEYGEGACYTSTTLVVTVHPQLVNTYTVTADTICVGESSKLIIKSSGGLPSVSQYAYIWSNGLIGINSHVVVPTTTTVYTVTVSDGCSDDAVSIMTVAVSPQYYPLLSTSPIKCYGESGQATVNINPSGNYSYAWNTSPVQTTNVLNGLSGKNYLLNIKNLTTGCLRDTFVKIPGYGPIKALFTPNPNLNCVPFNENTVTFIDQSNGATSGDWNFNGTVVTYTPGQTVTHLFETPGKYNVTLTVKNEGDCESENSLSICILESTDLFFPDIFSPNKDGANEVLYVRGNGIKELRLLLFDRWGSVVFESTDVNIGWDGTYKGKDCEVGIYAYTLEARLFDNKKINKKGEITLVR
jgi:gliding motility-associated-like protein